MKWSIDPPDPELEYTLRVAPPVPAKSLPTFHPKKRRPLSPMLRERFGFVSSLALGSKTWLGPAEMAGAMADPKSREMHSTLREHWEGSAPNLYPDERLSLFVVHAELVESRVYLVWVRPKPSRSCGCVPEWTRTNSSPSKPSCDGTWRDESGPARTFDSSHIRCAWRPIFPTATGYKPPAAPTQDRFKPRSHEEHEAVVPGPTFPCCTGMNWVKG